MAAVSTHPDLPNDVGAFMSYDEQGIAVFLGRGDVAIYHDDGTVMGNAGELSDVRAAVAVARLRATADLIEKGHA